MTNVLSGMSHRWGPEWSWFRVQVELAATDEPFPWWDDLEDDDVHALPAFDRHELDMNLVDRQFTAVAYPMRPMRVLNRERMARCVRHSATPQPSLLVLLPAAGVL